MVKRSIFYLILCVFLSACGGSNSSPSVTLNPVRVNAGLDIRTEENTSVKLSGLVSGGDGVYIYTWSAPSDINIIHEDTTSSNAILTAPSLTTSTSYIVNLQVVDSLGAVGDDAITLTVLPVNIPPTPSITANTIEGYESLQYPVSSQIVLDGSASFDEDSPSPDAQIATYLWQQVSGNDLLQGIDTRSAALQLTSPPSGEPELVEFMLTVSDQEGEQASARITIELLGERGTLPEIEVGNSIAVFAGEQMPLSASVSSTSPNAAPFIVAWQHDFTGSLTIADATQQNTVALAPIVEQTTQISFELSAEDAFANEVSVAQVHTVYPPQKPQVNDTGVVLNADELSLHASYQREFPGQDAQYGPDRIALSGFSDKAGRGEHGFDFTPLNANGDPVDAANVESFCVRDNITGLIWELKNDDEQSIHYSEQTFTWYQEEENGGFAGELNADSSTCNVSDAQCNIESFVTEVNQQGLCGFFDWRVPNHAELQSIVHYGRSTAPLVDTEYFPRTFDPLLGAQASLWYWTNQSSADGVNNEEARNAWALDFATGVDNLLDKTQAYRIRLVRAGRNTE